MGSGDVAAAELGALSQQVAAGATAARRSSAIADAFRSKAPSSTDEYVLRRAGGNLVVAGMPRSRPPVALRGGAPVGSSRAMARPVREPDREPGRVSSAAGAPISARSGLSTGSRTRRRPKSAAQLIAEYKSTASLDEGDVASSCSDLYQSDKAGLWKAFGMHSEAGRALRKLYGAEQAGRRSVRPPKPISGAPLDTTARGEFIPGGASRDAADPRSSRIDRRAMASVEKPVDFSLQRRLERSRPSLIDFHAGKRRTAAAIDEREREQERLGDRPAAPAGRGTSTEIEKRRLQLQFQFKGGKALPAGAAGDALEGEIPMSLVVGKPSAGVAARRRLAATTKERASAAGSRPAVRFEDPGKFAAQAAASSPGRRRLPEAAYVHAIEGLVDEILADIQSLRGRADRMRGSAGWTHERGRETEEAIAARMQDLRSAKQQLDDELMRLAEAEKA